MIRSAARLHIHGHVQGVGYRWWAVEAATGLGLAGWVRNRRDGSVEVLAIGEEDAIRRLAQACLKGPAHARVRAVDTHAADDDGSAGFVQRETH